MKTSTLLLCTFLAAGVASVIATGCGPSDDEECSVSTCPTGCCDDKGVCNNGLTSDACGVGGGACQTCSGDLTCQSGTCTGSGGGSGTKPGAKWCTDYVTAYCDYQARCGTAVSVEACRATEGLLFEYFCGLTIAPALNDGRITADAQLTNTCFTFMSDTFSCEAGDEDPIYENPDCAELLAGKVALGGDCYHDAECANGWCDDSASCPGTCVARVGLGEPTSSDAACEDGLYQYYGDDTCQVPVAAGEDCSGLPPSSTRQGCVPGHYCDGTNLTCTPKGTAGDSCADSDACIPTLLCLLGECTARGNVGDPCLGQTCMNGLFCNAALPGSAGLCAEPGAEEAACYQASDCEGNLLCLGADPQGGTKGQCTAPVAEGEACADSSVCAEGLYCASGSCEQTKPDAETCTDNEECESGYCDAGVCGAFFGICFDPTP